MGVNTLPSNPGGCGMSGGGCGDSGYNPGNTANAVAKPAPIIICGPSGVGKSVLIKKLQDGSACAFVSDGKSGVRETRGHQGGREGGRDP